MSDALPTLLGGRYRVRRLLGRGGMGVVYEVEHVHTGQAFALKVLGDKALAGDLAVERVRREAHVWARIQSDHVVRVIDADTAPELGGAPYLVMELLEGQDFARACGDEPQPVPRVLGWLRQVAPALDKAHALGIVHRDLKPENLFLCRGSGGEDLVKILDFGLAKVALEGGAATATGEILGTPLFMAPEQAQLHGAGKVTPRADLFALGLLAHKLLTGRHYWRERVFVHLVREVCLEPMPPPSQRGSKLGPAFDAWFAQACNRDPAQRFDSAVTQTESLARVVGANDPVAYAATVAIEPPPQDHKGGADTTSDGLAPGTLLAGKFRVESKLGEGAMGAVYAIVHELTHHRRALKLLHPAARDTPDLVRRFIDEASAAGRVGDPHLVETFDAGTLPTGEPYVVMELLEGETLGALLARQGPLSPAWAAEIVAQAAEGIEAANRAGIIHRDLKPENLFVTTRDGRPYVKVMDFGVSKFSSTARGDLHLTRPEAVYGSPAYMAPEQLRSSAGIDARVDVFGLGVVLFEALTGVVPYDAPTIEALAARLLMGEPTRVESLRTDLPPGLVQVVHHAIEPNRDGRTPSAQELARELGPFRPTTHATVAAGEPAFAGEGAPVSDAVIPKRRPPVAAIVAVTGAVAVAVGAAIAFSRPTGAPSPAAAAAVVQAPPSTPPPPAPPPTASPPPPAVETPAAEPPPAAQAVAPSLQPTAARGVHSAHGATAAPAHATGPAPAASASGVTNSTRIGLAKSPFDP